MSVGVKVELENVESDHLIFTKSIKITPRYILVNKTDHDIIIKQEEIAENDHEKIILNK